ncbi:MAG: beta-hydroxyacyl-ACP dehydratase [Pirellulaceae bacterium]|nr:beta-hydroxyacyl-ACP dehydratase [Pirellulaceae bacterium]MCU0979280.1 beta-hydroxyacyl-ACP dehydratase [Pirellulaceae bacterium]
MAAKELLFDLSLIDFDKPTADIHEIRKYNPQRFEMEQLTAIVYEDTERKVCVGYKDVGPDEFWVRGHMPGMPLMPGVVMLECAAQMCSYFTQRYNMLGAAMVGFGGLEDVRFRDPVVPGDRVVFICSLTKVRPGRMIISRFQGVVRGNVVVEGVIKGIPIPIEALSARPSPQSSV